MIKKIIFLFTFLFISAASFSQQSKEELQRKQQELLKEIRDLNASLKDIRNNKNRSLANYNLIKRKIAAREELIQNINKDLRILDNNIFTNQLEINRLRRVLDTLKREYSKSLVFAYKNRSNYNYLSFIFSAATFNDAIKRITYLKSYKQYREQQVAVIENTQRMIGDKITTLNNSKNEKSRALQDQSRQLIDLEEDKKEQNNEVVRLKTQENDLAKQIRKRETDRRQMQNAIAAIIRRELAEAKKRAEVAARQKRAEEEEKRKRLAEQRRQERLKQGNNKPVEDEPAPPVATTKKRDGRPTSDLEMTDEGRRASINFESSKGSLPWPVSGLISIHFGTYKIPGTQLTGQSDGLYFSTSTGATVKAVADGEVSSVFDLGGEQAVTVKHGKYFTTYSHLSSVNVSQGQSVGPQTTVGRAASNDAGDGEVLFMVSNERGAFLNPESWLRRR